MDCSAEGHDYRSYLLVGARRTTMVTEAMRTAVFPRPRRSLKLFSDFNTLPFASVMGMVVFVILLVFMVNPTPFHGGASVDLAKVWHPVSTPGANREDAIKVIITRDGKAYCGSDQVSFPNVSDKIKDRLKEPEVEHKVYIVADARARWGAVRLALQGVQGAGIVRIAFLTDQRRR